MKTEQNFWTKYFKVYDALNFLIPYRELLNKSAHELRIKKEDKVLDMGCGTGNLSSILKKESKYITAIDNNKYALDLLKKKQPDIEAVLVDITKELPFKHNYFNKIACINVLYTLPKEQQQKTLDKMFKILSPGGSIVIVNPKKGWSAFKIYKEGIKRHIEKYGVLEAFKVVIKLFLPTIKILYYNSKIKTKDSYYFPEKNEQENLINNSGFTVIKTDIVYAEQSYLTLAKK